jgi:hypothetical protein
MAAADVLWKAGPELFANLPADSYNLALQFVVQLLQNIASQRSGLTLPKKRSEAAEAQQVTLRLLFLSYPCAVSLLYWRI